ncbi:acetyl-CoA synthetase-like protein [Aspergillus avenaceus]|uniref:Acetyl-CoA synthetase-like protein n=1 Tax=Aspergillus avenaceus TaxID=36643 RepID=A0A5N6TU78_ASPAV|nr:acetyl-CoA synthetase-like protein [Aspergillus avenaceus]
MSFVQGPSEPALWSKTLGQLIHEQATVNGDRTAVAVPWQGLSLSYRELDRRTTHLAITLLRLGLIHGEHVGILAGNSLPHVEIFLAAARIGCPVVSLHHTYTPDELRRAAAKTSCKLIFIASNVGNKSFFAHQDMLCDCLMTGQLPELKTVVTIGQSRNDPSMQTYEALVSRHSIGKSGEVDGSFMLKAAEGMIRPDDILSLEFTSGTTGQPKAAMLTHINLLSNARLVGDAMNLTEEDIVCCPAPLFHGFAIGSGVLASLSHGCSVVLPSDHFDAPLMLQGVQDQKATLLLGVPTMFLAELEAMKPNKPISSLRAAIAGGAAVSPDLTHNLHARMGVHEVFVVLGMTETGVSFISSINHTDVAIVGVAGRVMPHTRAKVLDKRGRIAPRGQKGELYVSGHGLQKGYYKDEAKTSEAMNSDDAGVQWMGTGDEAIIDGQDLCRVVGRTKDVIIRGGENISPLEIEERLSRHPCVSEVSVFGMPDPRYGEAVACLGKIAPAAERPLDEEVREWVKQTLGKHKAPTYIFWLGDSGIAHEFPRTDSGKIQKHVMQEIGKALIAKKNDGMLDGLQLKI